MEKGNFIIGEISINRNTSPDVFKEDSRFTVDTIEKLTIADSSPNTVDFIGGEFFAEAFFYEGNIERIVLSPVLRNYPDPGYPDEAFQKAKWNYCSNILRLEKGSPTESDENTAWYYFEGGCLFIQLITEGRDSYTGGDIIIDFTDGKQKARP